MFPVLRNFWTPGHIPHEAVTVILSISRKFILYKRGLICSYTSLTYLFWFNISCFPSSLIFVWSRVTVLWSAEVDLWNLRRHCKKKSNLLGSPKGKCPFKTEIQRFWKQSYCPTWLELQQLREGLVECHSNHISKMGHIWWREQWRMPGNSFQGDKADGESRMT